MQIQANCSSLDSDADGLADLDEVIAGTQVFEHDSDSDGLDDGVEYEYGLNPLSADDGADADTDEDGISNADEISRGTSAFGVAPVLFNLNIDHVPESGQILQADYQYYDADLSEEGNSEIVWHIGEYSYEQASYTPSLEDIGKSIQLCATPKSLVGLPVQGLQQCTEIYTIQASLADWTGLGPVTVQGRHDGHGVDIVILGDGWTIDQMEHFKQTSLFVQNELSNFDTMAVHRSAWNIHIVGIASNESGIDLPRAEPSIEVDTVFDVCKGCGSLERVVSGSNTKAYAAALEYFPQYDTIVVLANSTEYGGVASGSIMYANATPTSAGVSVHEFLHSFGKLADEYTYGSDTVLVNEPGQINVTINNDYATVKWNHWIEPTAHLGEEGGAVGLFEGGKYRAEGVWRPTYTSIMKAGKNPLYAVNSEGYALQVYNAAAPSYQVVPSNRDTFIHDKSTRPIFSLKSVYEDGLLHASWYVNDEFISEGSSLEFALPNFQQGEYEVSVIVKDDSGLILKDDQNLSNQEIHWRAKAL